MLDILMIGIVILSTVLMMGFIKFASSEIEKGSE